MLIDLPKDIQEKTGKKSYYIDPWVARQLDKIKKLISGKDRDYVIIIDGQEGCGKSSLASQIAYYLDKSFDQSRMCLTPEEFLSKIQNGKKGQVIVFDEAYTGLASRAALSQINKLMVEMMMEMRKKNLFVILCIPSVFYLERYVCLHRSRALFHCYFSKGKQGQYFIFNQKKLLQLYLVGKRKMSYAYPIINKRHEFYRKIPIDWEVYENRKISALKNKRIGVRTKKQQDERDALIRFLYYDGKTVPQIIKIFEKEGIEVGEDYIYDIVHKKPFRNKEKN